MSTELVVLGIVVLTALAFDFTNGFHDTANAMATSIATGALRPKRAVLLSAVLNFVGALLSVEVALTVTNAVIKIQEKGGAPKAELTAQHGHALLIILLAGLVGAIIWNLATWLVGLPSSSSHALFGGMIGATVAGMGFDGVKWIGDASTGKLDGVVGKVILPAIFSPLVAMAVAAVGTALVYLIVRGIPSSFRAGKYRTGQIFTSGLLSLAHGMNDAQKTMGILTLALIGSGHWTNLEAIPLWVKLACAVAIAAGTYVGGWRIIRTLGKGLVKIGAPQGFAAEASSAAVILASSHLGFALSTTHVATGSVLGTGVGKAGAEVRWRIAARLVAAWVITLPSAGLVAFLVWHLADVIGGFGGAVAIFVLLLLASGAMFLRSRRQIVDHRNVTDEWPDSQSASAPVAH